MADGRYWLDHDAQDIDDAIDEVVAARGSEASLSAALAAKQDVLTFDDVPTANSDNPVKSKGIQAPLAALIGNGSKNLFNIDESNVDTYNATYTVSGSSMTITGTAAYARACFPITLKAGKYKFRCTASGSGNYRVRFNTASAGSGTTIASDIDFTTSGNYNRTIELSAETTFFIMFYTKTTSGAATTTLAISNIIVADEKLDNITDDYEPYAPTNRELYEMILALQSGTRSASLSMQGGETRGEPEQTDEEQEESR